MEFSPECSNTVGLVQWIYTSEEIKYPLRNLLHDENSQSVCGWTQNGRGWTQRTHLAQPGHRAGQISVPAGSVLWCEPHSLWRSTLSQHVPEIFKDFQAQGHLGLLSECVFLLLLVCFHYYYYYYYHYCYNYCHCLLGLMSFMQIQTHGLHDDCRTFFHPQCYSPGRNASAAAENSNVVIKMPAFTTELEIELSQVRPAKEAGGWGVRSTKQHTTRFTWHTQEHPNMGQA